MSTTTSYEHYPKQHLPPSPPPSPPAAKRRHKKRVDSFHKLANTPLLSPESASSNDPLADQNRDSFVTRIIVTPILFISFIISLTVVNLRDRARRTKAHAAYASILTYIYPSSWLDPEPYQDPDDSKWCRGGSGVHVEPHDAIGPKQKGLFEGSKKKRESWHLNKKIRKVAKLEIGDAFEMRGRVIVGMIVIMALSSVMVWIGLKWLLTSIAGILFGSRR